MKHFLSEYHNLFLSLQDRYFRSLHYTSANELQTELILFITLAGCDNFANQFFQLWYETYQQGGVYHVECGMEGCQSKCQAGGINGIGRYINAYYTAYGTYKREKYYQHPDNAEHVEQKVCHSCATGLSVGR